MYEPEPSRWHSLHESREHDNTNTNTIGFPASRRSCDLSMFLYSQRATDRQWPELLCLDHFVSTPQSLLAKGLKSVNGLGSATLAAMLPYRQLTEQRGLSLPDSQV